MSSERVRFAAADGSRIVLQGRLCAPARTLSGIAVLCHPHPAYGGHMDVWLLPTIAERLAAAGWASLRFNFRTVGRAEPTEGRTECADLAAALDFLAARLPGVNRVAVVGWSFGALVGMLHGPHDPRVTDWVGIGAPTRFAEQAPMALPPDDLDRWGAHKTVIVGEHDTFFPPSTVGVLHPDEVRIVPDADHFLFDRDDEVAELVVAALS